MAREAIQNSVDAALETRIPEVRFRRQEIGGEDLAEFVDFLKLKDGPLKRIDHLGLSGDNFIVKSPADVNLELLYLEDHGTHGHGGHLKYGAADTDHFRKLCLWLGVEDQSQDEFNRATVGTNKLEFAGVD